MRLPPSAPAGVSLSGTLRSKPAQSAWALRALAADALPLRIASARCWRRRPSIETSRPFRVSAPPVSPGMSASTPPSEMRDRALVDALALEVVERDHARPVRGRRRRLVENNTRGLELAEHVGDRVARQLAGKRLIRLLGGEVGADEVDILERKLAVLAGRQGDIVERNVGGLRELRRKEDQQGKAGEQGRAEADHWRSLIRGRAVARAKAVDLKGYAGGAKTPKRRPGRRRTPGRQ